MREVWGRNGFKTSGAWAEVFGSDEWADEVFMAWFVGRYIGKVAEAGKAELNIPMYANAWLGPQPRMELPGDWPSGGPVARVMDVWHAAAPSLDLLAPDIYVDDFKGTCALYTRAGNPLFIPEARPLAGNLIWAIGKHAALGVSPFAVDDVPAESQFARTYQLLGEMVPQLAAWQAEGKVTAVLLLDGEESETVSLGGYQVTLIRPRAAPRPPQPAAAGTDRDWGTTPDPRPFALIINTAPDEFLLVGTSLIPTFAADSPATQVGIGSKDEGHYEKGNWIPVRRLNGDEFNWGLPTPNPGMLKIRLFRYQ
jgi:hypothetical protein